MNKKFAFLISFFVFCLARLVPFSYMIGSLGAFFSASTIAATLLGTYGSLWSLVLFFLLNKKLTSVQFLFNRIPLLFAGLSYRSSNSIVSVVAPLLCVVLFVIHPVGFYAWSYSMYWLVPVILFFNKSETIFSRALSSVLIAHAVGSVVWLYTHDMTPEFWLSLIPVVAVERIVMALSVTMIDLAIQKIKATFFKKNVDLCQELV